MNKLDLEKEKKKVGLTPLFGKIIVKETELTAIGSIIIPKTTQQLKPTEGIIIAVADDVEKLKIGDMIYYGKYAGVIIDRDPIGNQQYYLLSADDALCLVDNIKEGDENDSGK